MDQTPKSQLPKKSSSRADISRAFALPVVFLFALVMGGETKHANFQQAMTG
jgi:hypothetical protein